jgi:hypothetical protein
MNARAEDHWELVTIPPVTTDILKDDSWFEVTGPLFSGLAEVSEDTRMLFSRKQVVELWSGLESFAKDAERRAHSIYGSPGIGKSCEVWAWALTCASQKIDVLWVHVENLATAVCFESRVIERFGGDPEAVLKSRHLSDFGPAPPSRIRRRRDCRLGCDRHDCRDSLSRHVTHLSHTRHSFLYRSVVYRSNRVKRLLHLPSEYSVWKRCDSEAALLGFRSKLSINQVMSLESAL